MRSLLVAVALTCCVAAVFAADGVFDYRPQYEWGGTCDEGEMQSPINIDTSSTMPVKNKDANKLKIETMGTVSEYTVYFTGVSLEVTFKKFSKDTEVFIGANEYTIGDSETVKEGDLLAVEPLQMHLHTMSEHTFDGFYAPAEAHIVTKVKEGESDYCDKTGGCLAVFGVMLTFAGEGAESNAAVEALFDEMPSRQGGENGVDYEKPLNLDDFLPEDLSFYHYLGSLTTPPCSEIVTWHVFVEPVPISAEHVESHQQLVSFTPGDDCTYTFFGVCTPPREKTNHRNVQPYYGRNVYRVKV